MCPTINKLPKKKWTPPKEAEPTEMKKLRSKAYNYTPWRKLRNSYIKEHPLCEECLKKGKVVPAEDIHHRRSPFQNGEINYNLLMDPNNLEALCRECHGIEHGYGNNPKPEEVLAALEEFMNSIPD